MTMATGKHTFCLFQVQFRLKQIVAAEPTEKEKLLKELEEFADRGIPDLRAIQQTRQTVENKSNEVSVQCATESPRSNNSRSWQYSNII